MRVPAANVLGADGEGLKVAFSALDNGRISLAAGCVGIAQGCLDACVAYASERRQYYASEAAVRAANAAVQVHGGYGYVDEYPVGKYLRDARVATLYEGTSQIQKLIIGRALTGENAFA